MIRWKIILVFVVLLIILALRLLFLYHNRSNYSNGQFISFETTLLSEPKFVGGVQRLTINSDGNNKIFITTTRFPQFHYADSVRISGPVEIKRLNGASTQGGKVLSNKKIITTMKYPKIEAIKNNQKTPFLSGLAITYFIRQKIIYLFNKTLPNDFASLLAGIVFGIKGDMSKSFYESLQKAGVLHVIAASGMNVTIIAGFLSSFFTLFLRRQIALVLSITGIVFYAFLAGLEPSIVRASIMGMLVFGSQILGRQNLSIYSLFIAGYAMLFWSPFLINDVGFQLSFLATLGLLYIKPILEGSDKTKRLIEKSFIGSSVTTTISAQVMTLPVLLTNFGTYSVWSVLVNGLVLWTIPVLMVVGGVGALIGFISTPLASVFLYLSLPFLVFFERVVSFFASLPGAVGIENFPWQITVGYYTILISLLLFFSKRVNKYAK